MHIVPFSVFQVDVGDPPEWLVAFAVSVHGSTNNQAATSPLLRRKGRNQFVLFCVKTPRWFVLARGSDRPKTNNAKNTFNEDFFFWFWLTHASEVPTRSKPGSNQPPNCRKFVATKKTCIQVLLNFQCFCSKFVAFFFAMFDMKIVGYQTIDFFPSVRNPSTGAPGRLPGQPESPSNGSKVSKGEVVTPTASRKEARFYVSRLRVLLNVECLNYLELVFQDVSSLCLRTLWLAKKCWSLLVCRSPRSQANWKVFGRRNCRAKTRGPSRIV